MADLSDVNSAQSVKVIGSDATGVEQTPVQSTSAGGLHSNLRDASGNELLGIKTRALAIPIVDAQDPTYAAAAVGFVSASAATDVFTISGSATKTIKILKIKVSGSTTSGSPIKVTASLVKRSTANTGGTSSVLTNTPYDSTNPAATAVARSYTANPSALGTSVGVIRSESVATTQSGLVGGTIEWNLYEGSQPVVLRGTSEFLCVNFNGATISGAIISISVEWIEV